MLKAERVALRQRLCDQTLADFEKRSQLCVAEIRPDQRAVLFAALQVLAFVGSVEWFRRVIGFFLLHCGLDFPGLVVGAAVGMAPRTLSSLKSSEPAQLLVSLRRKKSGTKTKLSNHHVGPICRFLVEHKDATLAQMDDFLRAKFGISVKRHALRFFLRRYGLEVLRDGLLQPGPVFVGHSAWGGAFVFLRQAVRLDRLARRFLVCIGADAASRLVLSLFFKAVLGIQRLFHFSTLQDAGLAILTGGRRVLGRTRLGTLVRSVSQPSVENLLHHSEPSVPRAKEHTLSIARSLVNTPCRVSVANSTSKRATTPSATSTCPSRNSPSVST